MNDLLYKKLEDICLDEKRAIISGPFGSNISSKYFVDKGIPVIRGNNLSLSLDKFYDEGFVYVTKKKADELNCYAKKLDIIFTAAGTIGQVGLITNDTKYDCYVISNKQIRARLDPNKIDILYAYYWFTSPWIQKYLTSNNKGSTVPLLSLWEVKNLPIIYPKSMSKQKKISNIIDKISKKIELNNKINDELEVMAKTVYDYWFLQFEFPNEEGKPYKSSGGKMIWNEELKREIPEGWETKRLSDIEPNIITGKTPSTKNENYYNGNIPFITISDVRKNMFIVNTEQTLSEEGAKTQEKKYIPEDALCVTCIASPGLVAFSTKLSQTNQQINSIIFEKNYNKLYLYYYLKNYFKYTTGAKTGNTFANMNKEDFSRILVLYPKTKLLTLFQDKTLSLIKLIKKNTIENQELTALRDFLLPLLMNGQVGFKGDKAES